MKKNMGGIDKLVRLIVALLLVVAYFQGLVAGVLGIVLLVVAGIFVLTSLVSICPLYSVFGISSCPVEEKTK